MTILLIILAVLVLVLGYTTWNLHSNVVRQEDIIEYQVGYLRKVAYLISESKIYVEQSTNLKKDIQLLHHAYCDCHAGRLLGDRQYLDGDDAQFIRTDSTSDCLFLS